MPERLRLVWFGAGRWSLPAALVAALALSPVLAACGDDRPPKPSCPAGQEAEWDDGDKEWECERDDDSGGSGGSSKNRRR